MSGRCMTDGIAIQLLPTGYWHALGAGPCEWAQWPNGEGLRDEHFFPEASADFRRALRQRLGLEESDG